MIDVDRSRCVSLRVVVDEQNLEPMMRQCGREIDRRRGLADSALLLAKAMRRVFSGLGRVGRFGPFTCAARRAAAAIGESSHELRAIEHPL